ncbi:MAG: DUF1152 domain-containing protein [Anaerolineae bacterium]|nr:DUF1152 domain-containing protein [Anaerolineae bacterium]
MHLNLPILDQLANSQNILIAGMGGGFDIFCGLPLYFTLCDMGKRVHLANYSFVDLTLASLLGETETLLPDRVVAARGGIKHRIGFYPEGYLAEWFRKQENQPTKVWMFNATAVRPLVESYKALIDHLHIDALILIDGGVDSLMRGDESSPGTFIEDTITLAAVRELNVPVKLHACLGFGTEVEEHLCHHLALENVAAITKAGGFLGACALTAQMSCFQRYESACRYVWDQPNHQKSHISTRVIPAAHGEFANHHLYNMDSNVTVYLSALMTLYWWFDAEVVIKRNLLLDNLKDTDTTEDAFRVIHAARRLMRLRPCKPIPY